MIFIYFFLVQLGNFIHYMATFASGFIVGFTAVWQLALVTLAVVPVIAVIGGVHTTTLSKLSAKSQEAQLEAGNIAEQVRNHDSSTSFSLNLYKLACNSLLLHAKSE